ncbi:hypothetical protein NC652_011590 [Populus alba x Populus x berolinensis]|nr:hypothetical protein NC652_011590 [Populus alba x Populus x berolinensis]
MEFLSERIGVYGRDHQIRLVQSCDRSPFFKINKLIFIARISLHFISRLFFSLKFRFFKSLSIFTVWLGSMLKESGEVDFSFSLILAVYRFEHCK